MPLTKKALSAKGSKVTTDRHSSVPDLSIHSKSQKDNFRHIEIDLITPDLKQSRKYFNYESLEQLSDSILQKGVLQPVIVKKGTNGTFQLAAGERRLRAAKMAGLTKIPALITEGNAMEISLIENLQRENLKPLEEAEALASMVKEHGYTIEQLSQVLSKAKSTISEILSLNKLPYLIKEELWRTDTYPRRLLVEVAKQESPEMMLFLFNQIKNNKLNSGQVREITRRPKNGTQNLENIILREISELADHLKKIDQQEVLLLADELMKLKSLIEEVIHPLDNSLRAEHSPE